MEEMEGTKYAQHNQSNNITCISRQFPATITLEKEINVKITTKFGLKNSGEVVDLHAIVSHFHFLFLLGIR